MTIDQALGILRPASRTISALNAAYKAYMLQYHPDINPQGLELCKLGNMAKDFLMQHVDIWTQDEYRNQSPDYHIDEELDHIYTQIRHFPRLTISLVGVWLWVSGDTYPIKGVLKDLGFKWCRKKQAWSWKPANAARRYSKKAWGFQEIVNKYGKVDLDSCPRQPVAA